jgi:SAM-dependent methyltransferase
MKIEALDYVAFISLLRETNRPPGGKHTVRYWITNAYISSASRVLEIGSNTGFTSLELCRTARCRVVGVDVSEPAVRVAREQASQDVEAVRERVRFEVADVRALPFEDGAFDVVVCGGALSFVQERGQALAEIKRVLRPWGFLCVSPLCYREPPPEDLLADLKAILGFDVPRLSRRDWLDLTTDAGFEIYATCPLRLSSRSDGEVVAYVDELLRKPDLAIAPDRLESVRTRAIRTYLVFNRNHRYLDALLAVFRKRPLPEEIELFGVSDWMRHEG